MSTSTSTPRGGRDVGRLLWPVALLLALTGVVLLALGVAGTAGRASADLTGFVPGQQVSVPESGMSVWSRSAEPDTVCRAGGTTLLRPVDGHAVQAGGATFHEVARTPDGFTGTHPVSCDTEQAVYAGPFAPGTVATGLAGAAGLTLGLLLLPLGLALAVLALRVRRRAGPA
jgi:hypothetical protein